MAEFLKNLADFCTNAPTWQLVAMYVLGVILSCIMDMTYNRFSKYNQKESKEIAQFALLSWFAVICLTIEAIYNLAVKSLTYCIDTLDNKLKRS